MLVLSRISAALTADERDLSAWLDVAPRTSPRPTDQRSGELTGDLLLAGSAPCIADEVDGTDDAEEADIPFSPVPDDAPLSTPVALPVPVLLFLPYFLSIV
jgi:hypothetical protein